MKALKRGESMEISDFILDIGKKIEKVSGAKLKFPQGAATVPKEIPECQEKVLSLKGIQLRTEKQTHNLDVVELKKFDPCYSLNGNSKISCRIPGCPQTISRRQYEKQDLFLCKDHRAELTNLILKCCAEENVTVDVTSFERDDFKGYTSLIGVLERAFMHLKSKRLTVSATTDSLLAEVFLNTRNFLIITNALLNPDEDNTTTVVGPYLTIFLRLLDDPKKLKNLLMLLGGVMIVVMTFYGIVYQWVYVPLENSAAKIGFGVGILFLILIGQISDLFPPWLKMPLFLLIPFAFSLIFSGLYEWNGDPFSIERRREQMSQNQFRILQPVLHYLIPAFQTQIARFVARADAAGNLNIEQNA